MEASVEKDEVLSSMVNMFEPPLEQLCPFGDITLVIDDDFHSTLRLRVSSCILAMASKVFKAMFGSNFAEGHASEIRLKDPPAATAFLCRLLHHKYQDTDILNGFELVEFAIVVDKYDCLESLRLPTYGQLCSLAAMPTYKRLDHLITAAYMLDQPLFFRKSTQELVMSEVTIAAERFDSRCVELLPPTLLDSMYQQQTKARHVLTHRITELIDQLSAAAYDVEKTTFTYEFMQTLRLKGLWPLDHKYTTITSFLFSMEHLELPSITVSDTGKPTVRSVRYTPPRSTDGWDSGAGGYDFRAVQASQTWGSGWGNTRPPTPPAQSPLPVRKAPSQLSIKAIVNEVKAACTGICLDCIKGKNDDGACRIPHPLVNNSTKIKIDPVNGEVGWTDDADLDDTFW